MIESSPKDAGVRSVESIQAQAMIEEIENNKSWAVINNPNRSGAFSANDYEVSSSQANYVKKLHDNSGT